MMDRPLLVRVLQEPGLGALLGPPQWDLLLRQARRARLLPRLALALDPQVAPAQVRPHLDSARLLAERQREAVVRELEHIRRALCQCHAPVVLLKGAAYLTAGLGTARGRMFSDVDILVPHAHLGTVETALMVRGWAYGDIDAYDSRYYRRWMHELPPLTHTRRGTTLDVHHTILPLTARLQIDTAALFERLMPLPPPTATPDLAPLFTLSPPDMVLHGATHLFHEGEFDTGLRDLFDLDSLLREFGAGDASFWSQLLARAERIGLQRPLHHALRYTHELLGTPVPASALAALAAMPGAPPPMQRLLDACFRRALRPRHPSCELPGTSAALAALYLRSHWLRMPPLMLARHLGRKQLKRWFGRSAT